MMNKGKALRLLEYQVQDHYDLAPDLRTAVATLGDALQELSDLSAALAMRDQLIRQIAGLDEHASILSGSQAGCAALLETGEAAWQLNAEICGEYLEQALGERERLVTAARQVCDIYDVDPDVQEVGGEPLETAMELLLAATNAMARKEV